MKPGTVTIANPYLDALQDLLCRGGHENSWRSRAGKAIGCFECRYASGLHRDPDGLIAAFQRRSELVGVYAWAVPDDEVLRAIAEWSPIIEIGAGTGYWAALLQGYGADIIAFDESPGHNHWCEHDPYTTVRVGGPPDVVDHPDRTLFLCWPPMSVMAQQALEMFRGNRVIYIGEWEGCTANEAFHTALERDFEQTKAVDLPQYDGLHDFASFWERKEPIEATTPNRKIILED